MFYNFFGISLELLILWHTDSLKHSKAEGGMYISSGRSSLNSRDNNHLGVNTSLDQMWHKIWSTILLYLVFARFLDDGPMLLTCGYRWYFKAIYLDAINPITSYMEDHLVVLGTIADTPQDGTCGTMPRQSAVRFSPLFLILIQYISNWNFFPSYYSN